MEKQGWTVENSEVNKICYFNGKLFAVHKDLFGSDLLAMNGKDVVFIQCKTHISDMSKAVKEFQKYPFPDYIKKWIVRWELRKKEPIVRIL